MVWGARYTLGARYPYIKRNVENVWGACYLPENTVIVLGHTGLLSNFTEQNS
jgi:hypothetical protein